MANNVRARNQGLDYAPPRLQRLGPLAELTRGSTGTFKDVADKMKPEEPNFESPKS
jgi:hypothetical protein